MLKKQPIIFFAGASLFAALTLTPTTALAGGEIVTTGIKAIDDVFAPAAGIISDLEGSQRDLKKARGDILRALGAKEGSDMAVAVEKFIQKASGQITVVMGKKEIELIDKEKLAEMKAKAAAAAEKAGKKKGVLSKFKPKFKVPALPTSISIPFPELAAKEGSSKSIGKTVSAINEALDSTVKVMQTVMSIPTKLQATIAQAALLPLKAPKQIKEAGLTKEAGKKVMAGLKANVKVVMGLPKAAVAAGKEVKDLMAIVAKIGAGSAKAGANAATEAAKNAKEAAKNAKKK